MRRTENNAYRLLREILFAVERNHERMREEPDSYGDTHDKWDDEEDALNSLEESLHNAVDEFESAMEVRKSLRHIAVHR